MNANELARYKAYSLSLAHIRQNENIIKALPQVLEVVNLATATYDAITDTENRAAQMRKGIAQGKKELQESLAKQAISIASILGAYAVRNKHAALRAEMSFTPSDLLYASDQPLQVHCANILARARELEKELVGYGLTEPLVSSFNSLYNQYIDTVHNPRKATAEGKQARRQVSALLRELGRLFTDELDRLMRQFENSNPEFYGQYKVKRTVVSPGQRKTRVAGMVVDATTKEPIAGVLVSVAGTELQAQTDENGYYDLRTPVLGSFPIRCEKKGYLSAEKEISAKRGQVTTLDLALTKE